MNTAYYDMLILLQQETQALIRSNASRASLNQRVLNSEKDLLLKSSSIECLEAHAILAELDITVQ